MACITITVTCLVAVSLASLTFGAAIASPKPSRVSRAVLISKHNAVQIDGVNEPLKILRDTLKRDPRAMRFQVNWWMMVLSEGYVCIALYDRKQHTLLLDCHGHWDGGQSHFRAFYTGVTDGIISRAATAHVGQMQVDILVPGPEAFFDTLPQFGAHLYAQHEEDLYPSPKVKRLRSNNALQPTPPPPLPQRCRLAVQAVARLSFAVRPVRAAWLRTVYSLIKENTGNST